MRIDDGIRTNASVAQCPVTGIGRGFNPFVDPYLAEPYISRPDPSGSLTPDAAPGGTRPE